MSQIKRHYEEEVEKVRRLLNAALDEAADTFLFEDFIVFLAYNNKTGLSILEMIIEELTKVVLDNPDYFLTCHSEALREFTDRLLQGNLNDPRV